MLREDSISTPLKHPRNALPTAPPERGQNTDTTLKDLGLEPAESDALRRRHII